MSARETERFHNEGKLEVGGNESGIKKKEEHFHARETLAFRETGMSAPLESERRPARATATPRHAG